MARMHKLTMQRPTVPGAGAVGGHLLQKRVEMCCQEPETPFQTRLRPFPDRRKTNIYPIVDKQYAQLLSQLT